MIDVYLYYWKDYTLRNMKTGKLDTKNGIFYKKNGCSFPLGVVKDSAKLYNKNDTNILVYKNQAGYECWIIRRTHGKRT